MSAYGSTIKCKTISADETFAGKIHWSSFDPALPGSDDQNLTEVLTSGNDAGGLEITNVSKVVSNAVDTDSVVIPKTGTNKLTIDNSGVLKCQEFQVPITGDNPLSITYIEGAGTDFALLNAREAEFFGVRIDNYIEIKTGADIDFQTGAFLKGDTTTETVCTHLDLTSTTNLFPSKYDKVISDLANLEARVSTLESGGGGGDK